MVLIVISIFLTMKLLLLFIISFPVTYNIAIHKRYRLSRLYVYFFWGNVCHSDEIPTTIFLDERCHTLREDYNVTVSIRLNIDCHRFYFTVIIRSIYVYWHDDLNYANQPIRQGRYYNICIGMSHTVTLFSFIKLIYYLIQIRT